MVRDGALSLRAEKSQGTRTWRKQHTHTHTHTHREWASLICNFCLWAVLLGLLSRHISPRRLAPGLARPGNYLSRAGR